MTFPTGNTYTLTGTVVTSDRSPDKAGVESSSPPVWEGIMRRSYGIMKAITSTPSPIEKIRRAKGGLS
ncbi:MAG: hypothetical protein U5L72_17800 [Bacteroidales bacterium]|nr:hypothetical protein [Bacteroidales bacterium]